MTAFYASLFEKGGDFSFDDLSSLHEALKHHSGCERYLNVELSGGYHEEFYEWWPKLWPLITELRLTGEEPLRTDQLWEIFDYFGDRGGSGRLRLVVETPLTAPREAVERFIMKTHYIDHLMLVTTSQDAETLQLILNHARLEAMQAPVSFEPRTFYREGFFKS